MKKFKAFTLIETIIVIVVFCIGILTVIYGLSQTLRNKEYANAQIQSAFFAREGIELLFNLRDANYHKELPWNCIFNPADKISIKFEGNNEKSNTACNGYLQPGTILKISIGSENNEYIHAELSELKDNFDENFENFQIYFHTGSVINGETGFIYDHIGDEEEKTRFARYILISGVNEGLDTIDSDKLLKIESHVLYKKGVFTGEKIMETFIGNYEFNQ